jgi:hypothetical protein
MPERRRVVKPILVVRHAWWRRVCALVLAAATALVVALSTVTPAYASNVDFYCGPCHFSNYGQWAADAYARYLLTSYAHVLSPSNGWIGAGDTTYGIYGYAVGEIAIGYNGTQYLKAMTETHVHGSSTVNAHADFY